eukprot:Hpha_TRINITY_DN22664_c0_g1::TRINITY_DN22664_c0_g1_i1::g.192739::m.192739
MLTSGVLVPDSEPLEDGGGVTEEELEGLEGEVEGELIGFLLLAVAATGTGRWLRWVRSLDAIKVLVRCSPLGTRVVCVSCRISPFDFVDLRDWGKLGWGALDDNVEPGEGSCGSGGIAEGTLGNDVPGSEGTPRSTSQNPPNSLPQIWTRTADEGGPGSLTNPSSQFPPLYRTLTRSPLASCGQTDFWCRETVHGGGASAAAGRQDGTTVTWENEVCGWGGGASTRFPPCGGVSVRGGLEVWGGGR